MPAALAARTPADKANHINSNVAYSFLLVWVLLNVRGSSVVARVEQFAES